MSTSSLPDPAPGNGGLAARTAAHPYASSLPCPTDGVVYLPPRPTSSLNASTR
jgi:hypothetical protein